MVIELDSEWSTVQGPTGAMATLTLLPTAPVTLEPSSVATTRIALRRSILDAVDRGGAHPDFALILRAQSDGESRLRIDPALDDTQAEALAEALVREQIELYRALLTRRVLALLVVGLDLRDAQLLRSASAKVGAELNRDALAAPGSDAWLVQRFALFTSTDSLANLDGVLSGLSTALARRGERARRATGEFTLPPGGFGAVGVAPPASSRNRTGGSGDK